MENRKTFVSMMIIALVSAIVGGVFSGFIVYNLMNENPSDTSNQPGTAKVSKLNVKDNSTMGPAFKKVSSSVVSVVNYQSQGSSSNNDWSSIFGDSGQKDSDSLQKYGEGSGVIYSKKDGKGYIVTNNHVVSGAAKLEIIFKDGSKTDGKLVGTDKVTDLAVIQIAGDKVPATAEFGNSDSIAEGDPVIAIGSPLGSDYATSVTEGIVSSKSRTITTQDEKSGMDTGQATVIQTDAAINQGNSGGPLVNAAGQVIGINSMKLASSSDGTTVEGMGFAIPSNEVVKIINALVTNKKVKRPSLGVRVTDLSLVSSQDQRDTLKLPKSVTQGILIASVNGSSPARTAGLKKYDVITAVDGKKVNSVAELHTALYAHSIGDTTKIKYYRDGKSAEVTVKLTQEAE